MKCLWEVYPAMDLKKQFSPQGQNTELALFAENHFPPGTIRGVLSSLQRLCDSFIKSQYPKCVRPPQPFKTGGSFGETEVNQDKTYHSTSSPPFNLILWQNRRKWKKLHMIIFHRLAIFKQLPLAKSLFPLDAICFNSEARLQSWRCISMFLLMLGKGSIH